MSIEDILADYNKEEYVAPRLITTKHSFNRQGISIYYYIDGKDSQGFTAGLKLDFFGDVRFSNYKRPHPRAKYEPYFDKFSSGYSCSYEEMQALISWTNETIPISVEKAVEKMAIHWNVSTQKFTKTLEVAYDLLFDAEENDWISSSGWECGEFLHPLPPPKDRSGKPI